MKQRMVRVIHPNFKPFPNGLRSDRVLPKAHDYVAVPYLSTVGTFRLKEIISPSETLALAKLTNRLEKNPSKRMNGFNKV